MLDRAPVLLGARRDLAREGDDAVGVGAIGAVELLQRIEIGEMVAVEHEIVGALDLGDAVDRKAYRLKNTDEEIEQQKRNDAGVDHRRGQHHQRVGPEQVGQQLLAQLPVAAQQLFFECDTAMLEADAQLCAALGELGVELAFEPADFFDQLANLRRHFVAPRCESVAEDAQRRQSSAVGQARPAPTGNLWTFYLWYMCANGSLALVRSRRFPPFGLRRRRESSTLCTQGPARGPFFMSLTEAKWPAEPGHDAILSYRTG